MGAEGRREGEGEYLSCLGSMSFLYHSLLSGGEGALTGQAWVMEVYEQKKGNGAS